MEKRGSGILLHITSLSSEFGIGDLGPRAYDFVDFLQESGQRFWQILPLTPTDPVHENSPYHSRSAFAGNTLLISPEKLVEEGYITEDVFTNREAFPRGRADYQRAAAFKNRILDLAYERFKDHPSRPEYEEFRSHKGEWLDDYALFVVLKIHFGGKDWTQWPEELRDRDVGALARAKEAYRHGIEREVFFQYVFFRQWEALKSYCDGKGVKIIGDLPYYVVHDSADVWAHPGLFDLDANKRPRMVAGVPPDYFSETGQLWGNPVYRWDVLKARDYGWWIRRIRHHLQLYDLVRIDHFRGLVAYWQIPAGEKTATNGQWVEAPARDFLTRITGEFPHLPIIAEDLGVITPDVVEVMEEFRLKGMKILLFAFGEDLPTNPYAPHNLNRHCLVYTGTHDNNTARGWFEREATPEMKKRIFGYMGREVRADEISWELVRLAMMSVADTAIFPMQDLLGLREEARMNRPAKKDGNWQWRLKQGQLTSTLARKLYEMTRIFGRTVTQEAVWP